MENVIKIFHAGIQFCIQARIFETLKLQSVAFIHI